MIILCDLNSDIVNAWRSECNDLPDIEIYEGSFQRLLKERQNEKFVLTTAGNSFGVMGGGLDLQIAQYFPDIEQRIRDVIRDIYGGLLPVGNAILIGMDVNNVEGIIYPPTMLAPMPLYKRERINVYLATRAALVAYQDYRKMVSDNCELEDCKHSLVLPGFGGRCGGVAPNVIAALMKLAIQHHRESYYPANEYSMRAFMKMLNSKMGMQ